MTKAETDQYRLEQISQLLSFSEARQLQNTLAFLLTRYVITTQPEHIKTHIAEDVELLLTFIGNINDTN